MTGDLDNLAAAAAAVDAEVAPPAAQFVAGEDTQLEQVAPTAEVEAAELAAILQAMTSLFVPLFPSLAAVYTPEACRSLAAATVPFMRKRGWTLPGIMAAWAEEIALAVVAFPLAFATWTAVNADIAQAKAKADKKDAAGIDLSRSGSSGEPVSLPKNDKPAIPTEPRA